MITQQLAKCEHHVNSRKNGDQTESPENPAPVRDPPPSKPMPDSPGPAQPEATGLLIDPLAEKFLADELDYRLYWHDDVDKPLYMHMHGRRI